MILPKRNPITGKGTPAAAGRKIAKMRIVLGRFPGTRPYSAKYGLLFSENTVNTHREKESGLVLGERTAGEIFSWPTVPRTSCPVDVGTACSWASSSVWPDNASFGAGSARFPCLELSIFCIHCADEKGIANLKPVGIVRGIPSCNR